MKYPDERRPFFDPSSLPQLHYRKRRRRRRKTRQDKKSREMARTLRASREPIPEQPTGNLPVRTEEGLLETSGDKKEGRRSAWLARRAIASRICFEQRKLSVDNKNSEVVNINNLLRTLFRWFRGETGQR